jgi:hypothetical protein
MLALCWFSDPLYKYITDGSHLVTEPRKMGERIGSPLTVLKYLELLGSLISIF